MTTAFKSSDITINVKDTGDFIEEFNKALQENEITKTFIVNDYGEGWVETVDVEDRYNIWLWNPIH